MSPAALIAAGMLCTYTVPAAPPLFAEYDVPARVVQLALRVDGSPGAWVEFVGYRLALVQWLVGLDELRGCRHA